MDDKELSTSCSKPWYSSSKFILPKINGVETVAIISNILSIFCVIAYFFLFKRMLNTKAK